MRFYNFLALFAAFWVVTAMADSAQITVYKIIPNSNTQGEELGTLTVTDTPYGLLVAPNLKKLPPGIHGMHIHENASCAEGGMAAGGHWDPQHTGKHLGPYDNRGHLGDLPALTVTMDNDATLPVLAPRLKVADLKGHSVIIHASADNYSDNPPMGGSSARIACGVVSR